MPYVISTTDYTRNVGYCNDTGRAISIRCLSLCSFVIVVQIQHLATVLPKHSYIHPYEVAVIKAAVNVWVNAPKDFVGGGADESPP